MADLTIEELNAAGLRARLPELTEILHATVSGGAAVSFILPFSPEEARAFWERTVLPGVQSGGRVVLAALLQGRVRGTVQLGLEMPPNQAHRCEVSKMLVHPDYRRRGIARLLMTTLEQCARTRGKTLITLDTRTGDKAQPLYAGLGYLEAGTIPNFARNVADGGFHGTTYMYKQLRPCADSP